MAAKLRGTGCRSLTIQPAGMEVGTTPPPLSRGLMVDAVLYACTSAAVPNGDPAKTALDSASRS